MHIILTGATGLVGSAVLSHVLCLKKTSITRLSILSRNPDIPLLQTAIALNRNNTQTVVEVIPHTDFTSYSPELLKKLHGANGLIWALGPSQTDVGLDEYIKAVKTFTLEAAKALNNLNNVKFNFIFVSSEGTTHSPGSFTPRFAKIKGETESGLLEMHKSGEYPTFRPYSVRLGAVDGSSEPIIWQLSRNRKAWTKKLSTAVLLPIIKAAGMGLHIPITEVSQILLALALGDGEPLEGEGVEHDGRIVNNLGARRLAGLVSDMGEFLID